MAFAKEQVIVHFDWDALVVELLDEKAFPHMMFAVEGGVIVGMILLNENISDDIDALNLSPKGSVWIYRLFVDEAYRNKGFGAALVKASEAYTKENGMNEIWLDTIQAGQYYEEKLGYHYKGEAPYKDQVTKIYKREL